MSNEIKKPTIPIMKMMPNYKNQYQYPIYLYPQLIAPDEIFVFMDDRCALNIIPYRYMISNYGRVWDVFRQLIVPQHFDAKFDRFGNNVGYLYFSISVYISPMETKKKNVRTNRMVLLAFNWFEGCEKYEANHLDGNHANNNLSNLRWDSTEENKKHARENKLYPNGEDRFGALLKNEQVHEICKMMESGLTNKEISNITGVDTSIISNIRIGHSYRYIGGQYIFPKINKLLDDEIVHKICNDICQNMSNKEISEKYNINESVVCSIRNKNSYKHIVSQYKFPRNIRHVSPNNLSEDIVKDICERLQSGQTPSQICQETGIKKERINSIISGHGYKRISSNYNIPSFKRNISDELVIEICNLLMKGEPSIDIAKKFNINVSIVTGIKNKINYKHISCNYDFPKLNNNILNESIVHEICIRLQNGYSVAKISKELNIPSSKIYHIKYRETHQEITNQYTW